MSDEPWEWSNRAGEEGADAAYSKGRLYPQKSDGGHSRRESARKQLRRHWLKVLKRRYHRRGPTTRGSIHFSRHVDHETRRVERILLAAGRKWRAVRAPERNAFDIDAAATERTDQGRFDVLLRRRSRTYVLADAVGRVAGRGCCACAGDTAQKPPHPPSPTQALSSRAAISIRNSALDRLPTLTAGSA